MARGSDVIKQDNKGLDIQELRFDDHDARTQLIRLI